MQAAPRNRFVQRIQNANRIVASRRDLEVLSGRTARSLLESYSRDSDRYDVVYVEHATLAPLLPRVRSCPWAITLQNVASERYRQAARVAPRARHRGVWRLQARKARRLERWIARKYDLVFVPSSEDASLVSQNTVVVPNGVDLFAYPPSALPRDHRLVFIGTLNYPPNVDGIVWFCQEVFPLITEHLPGISLEIVGRTPAPQVVALANGRISVHPNVEETYSFLRRARIAIVPLRMGTGTRLKALEAMAAGRVVVGTTIGLAGIELKNGFHAVVADDPSQLGKELRDLITDDSRALRIAASGQALVASKYDWRKVGNDFAEHMLNLARVTKGG